MPKLSADQKPEEEQTEGTVLDFNKLKDSYKKLTGINKLDQ